MFTDAEKIDIRRFCGYGMFGSQALPAGGYRFSTAYGTLEYKINNMLVDEETVVRTYLANLQQLESDIVGTRSNLDTDQAAVWTHNKNEQRDREQLFDSWRRKLCGFLGVPPGSALGNGNSINLVV